MPSYRLELEIGDLRSGKAPKEVMDAALASLGTHHVDATDIKVIDGTPLILVRFTVPASSEAEEDTAAQMAARRTCEAVERVASTGRHRRSYGAATVPGCQSADLVTARPNDDLFCRASLARNSGRQSVARDRRCCVRVREGFE